MGTSLTVQSMHCIINVLLTAAVAHTVGRKYQTRATVCKKMVTISAFLKLQLVSRGTAFRLTVFVQCSTMSHNSPRRANKFAVVKHVTIVGLKNSAMIHQPTAP